MRLLSLVLVLLALAPACARREEFARPTTLTSAAPPGPPEERPQDVLADELCRREEACDRIGRGGRYPSIETCRSDLSRRVGRELASWRCSPAASRARFEECVLSVRSEICQTVVDRADRLPACRSNVVCGV